MTSRGVAIVTGGGSGIGGAIAIRLAEDGFAVVVLDLDSGAAESVTGELAARGLEGFAFGGVDVSDRAQVNVAVQRVRTEVGPPVVLVNNAGIPGFKEFLSITDDKWNRIMEVNLNGPFYFCQAVVPDMIEAGWGRIVNISSSSVRSPASRTWCTTSPRRPASSGSPKPLASGAPTQGDHGQHDPPGVIDTPMLRGSETPGPPGPLRGGECRLTPVRVRARRRTSRTRARSSSRKGRVHHGTGDRCERRPQYLIHRGRAAGGRVCLGEVP